MDFARNRILQRLRTALKTPQPLPYPEIEDDEGLFPPLGPEDLPELVFAQRLQDQGGNFLFCEDWQEARFTLEKLFLQFNWAGVYCYNPKLRQIFQDLGLEGVMYEGSVQQAEAGILTCDALIARSGSILLSSAAGNGRQIGILPPVQLILATTDQVVYSLKEGLERSMAKRRVKPSMLSLVTGPSRTADIEKTLVTGAHGAKTLYVILIEP